MAWMNSLKASRSPTAWTGIPTGTPLTRTSLRTLAPGLHGRRRLVAEAGLLAEQRRLVRALPRRVDVVAAEVPVRRRRPVDRPAQIEVADDRGRPQIEVL